MSPVTCGLSKIRGWPQKGEGAAGPVGVGALAGKRSGTITTPVVAPLRASSIREVHVDITRMSGEQRDELLREAARVGAFFAQFAVQFCLDRISAAPEGDDEYHPEQQFGMSFVKKFLDCSDQTIRNRIRDGLLRAYRSDAGHYRFLWKDIKAFQEQTLHDKETSNGQH